MNPLNHILIRTILSCASLFVSLDPLLAQAGDAEGHFFHGYYLETAKRDFQGALDAYAAASAAAKSDAERGVAVKALTAAGRILVELGRLDEAKARLQEALTFDPKCAEALRLQSGIEAGTPTQDSKIAELVVLASTSVPASFDAAKELVALGDAARPAVVKRLAGPSTAHSQRLQTTLFSTRNDYVLEFFYDALASPDCPAGAGILGCAGQFPASGRLLDLIERGLASSLDATTDHAASLLKLHRDAFRSETLRARYLEVLGKALADPASGGFKALMANWKTMPNCVVRPVAQAVIAEARKDPAFLVRIGFHGSGYPLSQAFAGPAAANELPDRFWDEIRDLGLRLLASGEPLFRAEAFRILRETPIEWSDACAEAAHVFVTDYVTGRVPNVPEAGRAVSGFYAPGSRTHFSLERGLESFRLLGLETCPLNGHEVQALRGPIMLRIQERCASDPSWKTVGPRGLETIGDAAGLAQWSFLCRTGEVVPFETWWRLASHADSKVREQAYGALASESVSLPSPLPAATPSRLEEDLIGHTLMRERALAVIEHCGLRAFSVVISRLAGEKSTPAGLRSELIQVLARIDGERALPVLRELSKAPDATTRDLAAGFWLASGERCLEDWMALAKERSDRHEILSIVSRWIPPGEKGSPTSAFHARFLDALPVVLWTPDLWHLAEEKCGPEELKPIVRKLLGSPVEAGVLAGVIKAAADLRLRDTGPAIVAALDHVDGSVRLAAKAVLEEFRTYHELKSHFGESGAAEFEAALKEALRLAASVKSTEREAGALALGALGNPRAVGPLLRLVEDAEAAVRTAALSALRQLNAR